MTLRQNRCKGHTHKGHREKVLNVMNFRIFQGVFRVFSGCFQGVFRVFQCVFQGVFFPMPFPGLPFGPFQLASEPIFEKGMRQSTFQSGVARGLLQGRPLQLPMGWGVGEELTKSWPTFEQLCVQNLALAISYCFSPTKSAYKIRLARS